MNAESRIPNELRKECAWVVTTNRAKIPINPVTGKAASPSDKTTWNDYETCLNAVYGGKYDNIGYCFHDNSIIGIDIDAGFDDYGLLSDLAMDIVGKCRSYTEISKSGRGVHILVKGKLPFRGANNRAGVEIYQTGRFFILTGKQIIYQDMIENQEAIDYIVNAYFKQFESISGDRHNETFYKPKKVFKGGKLSTVYPEIAPGCRNLSLTSLAGQLHTMGASAEQILAEITKVNSIACKPPIEEYELQSIVKSVMRYKRTAE